MKKSLLMMAGILVLFSFIVIGQPTLGGGNGGMTTYEHGAGF
ncbi:hypothetical protein ACFWMP_22345 [Paenibacillus sp. NPDC058367]